MPLIHEASLNELNALLDAEYVLSFLGATNIQHSGPELRAFCPIHHSDHQRSLSIRLEGNLCICHNTGCPVNNGGTLLWLWTLKEEMTIKSAAEFWAKKMHYKLKYQAGKPAPEDFKYKEMGGFSRQRRFWRNRIVLASQPITTLQSPQLDGYESIFRYNIANPKTLRKALQRTQAFLYGPFYCDFDNPFPDANNPKLLNDTPFGDINSFEKGVNRAQQECRSATQYFLSLGIPEEALSIHFSGRGFHLEVDPRVFGIRPSPDLHQIYHKLAFIIADVQHTKTKIPLEFSSTSKPTKFAYPAKFQTLDQKIYNSDRLWRVSGTMNTKSGLFKIPLHISELENLNAQEIINLAKQSRTKFNPPKHLSICPNAKRQFILAWKTNQKAKVMHDKHPEHTLINLGFQIVCVDQTGKTLNGTLPPDLAPAAVQLAKNKQCPVVFAIKH